MDWYDSIIVGAGHNRLVCAAYLAQSGQRVLVLEASDAPGGLGAGREFHPGFHASVAHTVSHFSRKIARDLKLASHGYEATSNTLSTVGFNSNSAFYAAFKKCVGQTPAQYRRLHLKKAH